MFISVESRFSSYRNCRSETYTLAISLFGNLGEVGPKLCNVVRVTNSGIRNGNVYMSLYQPFVYLCSANSQIFA